EANAVSGLTMPLVALERGEQEVDLTVQEEDLRPAGAKPLDIGPVRIRGKVQVVEPRYVFIGTLTGVYFRQCDRCLKEIEVPFNFDVLWSFERGTASQFIESVSEYGEHDLVEDESETVLFDGSEIDLALQAWEELVLSAPSKTLCKEDCAGLCPYCGADLNTTTCSCRGKESPKEFGNKGLSGLASLFPDLDPKRSKE
ncbi:MAG: DUF177 domain-containing protein, partial [Candidatus Hydrogenedentes bacterium]|nr:DUF177 domain-containing protein [Candidatus Hydrogenedentota bacterium]